MATYATKLTFYVDCKVVDGETRSELYSKLRKKLGGWATFDCFYLDEIDADKIEIEVFEDFNFLFLCKLMQSNVMRRLLCCGASSTNVYRKRALEKK